jgi:hypothetical protein
LKTHLKVFKKLDFYTSKKSTNRNGYVMKGKTELLTNIKWIKKNVDYNGGNVAERNSKSMQFFFLKIVKIEPTNKFQSF